MGKFDSITAYQDQLPGGLGDDKQPGDFDPAALKRGLAVEMEHTDDERVATEIAIDHLTEDPDYYAKLATIEDHGEGESRADDIRVREEPERVFIEGDELVAEMTQIADALETRGCGVLAQEAREWLTAATE